MSAESIINEIGDPQGWNDETKLALCLQYISNQGDDAGFRDFLEQVETPDPPTSDDLESRINTLTQRLAGSYDHPLDYEEDRDALRKLQEQLAATKAREALGDPVDDRPGPDDPHGPKCAMRLVSAAECTCGKAEREVEDEEVVNAPCAKCGRTDLLLHENMQCTECWPPRQVTNT